MSVEPVLAVSPNIFLLLLTIRFVAEDIEDTLEDERDRVSAACGALLAVELSGTLKLSVLICVVAVEIFLGKLDLGGVIRLEGEALRWILSVGTRCVANEACLLAIWG